MPEQANIIAIYDNADFSASIEYTFNLLFSVYGIDYSIIPLDKYKPETYHDGTLVISYGRDNPGQIPGKHIHIYSSDFFGLDYLKPTSMPREPLKRHSGLPVIYAGSGNFDGWVRKPDNLIETNIDIIASSFFMVSRYEEVIINARDNHDRFPATASLAYREGFLDRPIVNEYIELLWNWIRALKPEAQRKQLWPENRDFAVCLTHDVDALRSYSFIPPIFRIYNSVMKKRSPYLSLKIFLAYLSSLFNPKNDPDNSFAYMLDTERTHGLKSSFYFMGDRGPNHGSSYAIGETKSVKQIRDIEDSGCEVGLHAGYNSCDNLREMTLEKSRLDEIVRDKKYGCRQHYLRWKTPETWRIQEQLGILYDTTLSFADHVGFRCGICLPFKPFDVLENREINIWELPLTVMEGSLQNPNYQDLPPKAAYEEMVKLCDEVRKFNGLFVLLWHNSSFDALGGWEGWKEVYEVFMEYIAGQDAWGANGREIVGWWG